MRFPFSTLSILAVAALLPAQTQIVRGEIEDLRQTQGQFFLKCTNIPVQSTTLNLINFVDTQAILDVVNVGTATNPRLDVHVVTPVAKTFDMGDLRIGHSGRWEVNAPAGSFAMMFVDFTFRTGWMPFGTSGVFLLSGNAATLASGVTNGQNQFELNFTMPNIPQLIGTSFTGQALIGDHGNWLFSNADCKAVQAQ
jgi:hypothetical protein